MKVTLANGFVFEYEQYGPVDGTPVLAVMGLGAQLTIWPPCLVAELTSRGCRVTCFDNRDVGLSHHCDDRAVGICCDLVPAACFAWCGWRCGCGPPSTPYSLRDMADDAAAFMVRPASPGWWLVEHERLTQASPMDGVC